MSTLPKEFLDEIRAILGDEFDAFMSVQYEHHVTSLRVNPFRENAAELAADFSDGPVPWEDCGFYTRPGTRPGLSLAHFGGAYYMQEASAMLAAAALEITPGMRVLDLCAAPGGKSGQLARRLAREGILVSNEPMTPRSKALAGNLERLGVPNCVVTNEYPDRLEKAFPAFFDAILVDAPCSGEGMFRRDPGAIDEWNPDSPRFCHERQLTILDSAAEMLKSGGQLVFSTCTFNRTENEGTVTAFLAAHPEFSTEDFELPGIGVSANGALRAWPHKLRGEGHFVCRMRKAAAETPARKAKGERMPATDKAAQAAFDMLLRDALGKKMPAWLRDMRFVLLGDRLFAQPAGLPSLDKIKSPKPGLALCRVGKNYIEPDHSLAMALSAGEAGASIDLTDEDAWRYLIGETLPCETKGWTLVTWKKLPLGWGKSSGGMLKNHLPKGLRRPQGAPPADAIGENA